MPLSNPSTYLLDTNACIALINESSSLIRSRFAKELQKAAQMCISSVAVFELWYGVEKSTHQQLNRTRLESFFAGPLRLLSFDAEDAKVAGRIRATLDKSGKPMGSYDLLMGAQAIRHKATLVTANEREFRRIEDLLWQDWSKF